MRICVIALTVFLQACAARVAPTAPPTSSPLDPRASLQRDLLNLFAAPDVAHAHWAISINSLRTKEKIFELNSSHLMIPASNQKLLTTAAAAERLGWDYRFTTRLLATGAIADGTLMGNLVIIGSGDPTINPRHPERWRVFDDWAAALKAKGITIITGHVIGDDNAFAEPGWGMGWSWEDLIYAFGAPVGGLQYNENQIDVMVGPGMEAGARAIVMTAPLGSGLLVDNRVTTIAAGGTNAVQIVRLPGTTVLEVSGEITADAKPVTLTAAVENPTRFYLNAFREALWRYGIHVAGSMSDIDEFNTPPGIHDATELIVDRSPPLSEIIDVTNKWSRNVYAETLLLALAPSAERDAANATAALQETLTALGVAADSYIPRDGSGLSRYDYISADALTTLLTSLWANPKHVDSFRATLPVAGVAGTLANRLKGTTAESRVWAKTGSMSNVRALSGYLTTVDGEPMVFSIIVNNYRLRNSDIEALIDKALLRLVEFRR